MRISPEELRRVAEFDEAIIRNQVGYAAWARASALCEGKTVSIRLLCSLNYDAKSTNSQRKTNQFGKRVSAPSLMLGIQAESQSRY